MAHAEPTLGIAVPDQGHHGRTRRGAGRRFRAGGADSDTGQESDFLASIASARQEAQMLFELSQDLGNSLSLDDTLSVVSVRLRKTGALRRDRYSGSREDNVLIPKHVSGDNFRLFSSLEIPVGQGLSGWVVQNGKPILNGNPSVEPGYLNDPTKFSTLRSALSVPLDGLTGVIGVLTLYRVGAGRLQQGPSARAAGDQFQGRALHRERLKYQQAQSSATTDYLTGLPNARSLFLHLDGEVARCKRTGTQVAVMVCDLNGFKRSTIATDTWKATRSCVCSRRGCARPAANTTTWRAWAATSSSSWLPDWTRRRSRTRPRA